MEMTQIIADKVTILLPLYNGQKHLRNAIDSILGQSYKNIELLIINDASTDDSVSIVESYQDSRIRLLHNKENFGLSKTLNRGLREANTRWIARHDQDDISTKHRLITQLKHIKKFPDVALVGGQGHLIDDNGNFRRRLFMPKHPLAIKFRSIFANPFLHGSVLFNRDIIWNKYNGYNEQNSNCEDFELWSRMMRDDIKISNVSKKILFYREHPQSMRSTITGYENIEAQDAFVLNLNYLLGEDSNDLASRIWTFVLKSQFREGGPMLPKDIQTLREVFKKFHAKNGNKSHIFPIRMEKLRLHIVATLHSQRFGNAFRDSVRGCVQSILS